MMVRWMDKIEELVEKFNKRSSEDRKLYDDIKDLKRKIFINFKDNGKYYFYLENGKLAFVDPFDKPDIEIELEKDTFDKILNKELDALTAYISKKIIVRASLRDKLLISDLLK
jgi:putative sterol carrier protein